MTRIGTALPVQQGMAVAAAGWQQTTWNPYVGCLRVSPGCAHCYMFRDQRKYGRDPENIHRTSDKTFYAPLHLAQSHLIFTCSWSDFFLEEADEWRADAWSVIRRTPQHIYQILTKRPERMRECLPPDWGDGWPNVWLGVTAENQRMTNERLPLLLDVPAALRWVCASPLLGAVDLRPYLPHIGWVTTGAESGPDARDMKIEWVRDLRAQCVAAGIPFYFRQAQVGGVRVLLPQLDGRVWNELPPLPEPQNLVQQLQLFD